MEVLPAALGLIAMVAAVVNRGAPEFLLLGVLLVLPVIAGVMLWRGDPRGLLWSIVVQVVQIPRIHLKSMGIGGYSGGFRLDLPLVSSESTYVAVNVFAVGLLVGLFVLRQRERAVTSRELVRPPRERSWRDGPER